MARGKTVILSVCIPTYNRLEKLRIQIDSLLKLPDTRFNVIISDNHSSDDTIIYLSSIKDDRLKYVTHDKPVPPSINGYDALFGAEGRFSIFVLDKDFIDGSYLVSFIDELENYLHPIYGYCDLNNDSKLSMFEEMMPSASSFINSSYLCKHPSGYFFFTEQLKKEARKIKLLFEGNFPFTLDVMCAHFAANKYPLILAHTPMVRTETMKEASKTVSLSYTADNLWFAPKQVVERYIVFIEDLYELGLEANLKNIVLKRLIYRSFNDATINYAATLQREPVCLHYGIQPQKISIVKILQISAFVYDKLKNLKLIRERKMLVLNILFLINIVHVIKYKLINVLK